MLMKTAFPQEKRKLLTDKELIEWSADFVLIPVYMSENSIDYYEYGDQKYVLGEPIEWEYPDVRVKANSKLAQLFRKPIEWNPIINRNHTQMVVEKIYKEIDIAVKFGEIFVNQLLDVYSKDDPHIMYSCFDLAFQLTTQEILEAAYKAVNTCES